MVTQKRRTKSLNNAPCRAVIVFNCFQLRHLKTFYALVYANDRAIRPL